MCVCVCLKERDREGLLRQLQASAQQKAFQKHFHPVFAAAHTDTASKAVKTPPPLSLPAQHVSTKIIKQFLPALYMTHHLANLKLKLTHNQSEKSESEDEKKKNLTTALALPESEKRTAQTSDKSSQQHL